MANTVVSQSKPGILSKNITRPIIDEALTGSGTFTREFVVTTPSLNAGLKIEAISGTLDVEITTYDGNSSDGGYTIAKWAGKAATTDWDIKRSNNCLSRILVTVTYSDDVTFRLTLKPLDDSIVYGTLFTTQKLSVDSVGTEITSTEGRKEISIRNWAASGSSQLLYVKEDNSGIEDGWPLAAREGITLSIDVSSSIYLKASTGTIDVRIIEVS